MKPLQTLDHVMLWIARVFAIGCLGYVIYAMIDFYGSYVWPYHHYASQHRHFPMTRWASFILSIHGTYELFFLLLVAFLWNAALWWLRRDAGRFYLLLSGSLMFLTYSWRLIYGILNPYPAMDASEWINAAVSIVGFFAMAWVAFRAPGHPPLSFKMATSSPLKRTSETNKRRNYSGPFSRSIQPA
jgi:hypothetical protein